MSFINKTGSLNVAIPYKTLPINGIIRLIISDDPNNNPMIKQNDLLIRSDIFQCRSDRILLSDSNGNQCELCDFKAIKLDHLQQHQQNDCRIN